ncbi:MAG: hypothetical protein CMH56_06425 [Myxococcales bacterium]|nr:hypothetical protein [Myxococcales bacterium]
MKDMNRHYSKIQILAHQLAWWGCVLAVKWQHPLWAAAIMFAFTLFHLFMTRDNFNRELLLVITATVVGGLGDSLLVIGGALQFQPPGEFGLPIPLWMWGLWAGFGATLRYSMDWLVAQPWRGFVAGALVGPMVYSGGQTLQVVSLGSPESTSFVFIAVAWSAILGFLALYIQRSAPRTGLQNLEV